MADLPTLEKSVNPLAANLSVAQGKIDLLLERDELRFKQVQTLTKTNEEQDKTIRDLDKKINTLEAEIKRAAGKK